MKKILKLAFTDFKLIFRDPSLSAFFVLPFILYALLIWFVPGLVERYDVLIPYIPLFLVIGIVENTQVFCFISSMVLIEEKEANVAMLYGIIPINSIQYLLSRFIFPFFITVLLNVGLIAVQPLYDISWTQNIILSLLTALIVPAYVLGINSIVENRMQGMIAIKAFNMIVLVPIASFFVPDGFVHLFGFLPTHWVFQSIIAVIDGNSILLTEVISVLYLSGLIIWFSWKFIKNHFI